MKRQRFQRIFLLLLLSVCASAPLCAAEAGKLVVFVQDLQQRPVKSVEIAIDGVVDSGVTGADGKAVLALSSTTNEGDWVSLSLLHSPSGQDLVMATPWDGRVMVPPFADDADNFVKIVVIERGDKEALGNGRVLASLAAKINRENAPRSSDASRTYGNPQEALKAIAKQYGFDSTELDEHIRAWGARTDDPYEAGLTALYQHNYREASWQLQTSIKWHESRLAGDQKPVEADQRAVADAAFFLGASLLGEGKYRESAEAYRRRLKLTPDDPRVLNNLALSL